MAQAEPLGPMDHVGEYSDTLGFGGNILQALDQGSLIFGHGGGGFLPGTSSVVPSGLGPLFEETAGVQNAFNGLGAVTGLISAVQGFQDMTDDSKWVPDRIMGGANVASGGVGAAGGVAGIIEPTAAIANAGGAAGLGADAFAATTWGAGAASAGAGVATAAATGAAVIGAGTAGWGVGRYGDRNMENLDWLRDKNGKNRSITDWGSQGGADVQDAVRAGIGGEPGSLRSSVGDTVGYLAGLNATATNSVLGVPLAIGSTAAGLDSALGGVPSQTLAAATGGLSSTVGGAARSVMDFAHWLAK